MIYKIKGVESPVQIAEISLEHYAGHVRFHVNGVHIFSLTDSGKLYKQGVCKVDQAATGLRFKDDQIEHY